MRDGGWKEKMEQGLKGMIRRVWVGKGNSEKEKGQGGEKKGDEIIRWWGKRRWVVKPHNYCGPKESKKKCRIRPNHLATEFSDSHRVGGEREMEITSFNKSIFSRRRCYKQRLLRLVELWGWKTFEKSINHWLVDPRAWSTEAKENIEIKIGDESWEERGREKYEP